MKYTLLFLIFFVLSLKAFAVTSNGDVLIDKIVATVNSDIILSSDINYFKSHHEEFYYPREAMDIKQIMGNESYIIKVLIDNKLMEQAIKDLNLKVSDIMLEKKIKGILRQENMSKENLKRMLINQGTSFESWKASYRKQLERYMLFDHEIKPRIAINDFDLKNFYNEKVATVPKVREFELVDFVAKGSKQSLKKLKSALHGNGLNKTALQNCSQNCTMLELDFMSKKDLRPEMAKALNQMKEGQKVSTIVKIDGNYHLFYIKSERAGGVIPFESIKDKLYNQYYQVAMERELRVWLDEKKKSSFIEVK